jgi:hypothetical protein
MKNRQKTGFVILLLLPLLAVLISPMPAIYAYEVLFLRRELLRGDRRRKVEADSIIRFLKELESDPPKQKFDCKPLNNFVSRGICVGGARGINSTPLGLDLDGVFANSILCPVERTLSSICTLPVITPDLSIGESLVISEPSKIGTPDKAEVFRLAARGSITTQSRFTLNGAGIIAAFGDIKITNLQGSGAVMILSLTGNIMVEKISNSVVVAPFTLKDLSLPIGANIAIISLSEILKRGGIDSNHPFHKFSPPFFVHGITLDIESVQGAFR